MDANTGLPQSSIPSDSREHLLQLLIDGIDDYAIYLLDPNGCVATWNAGSIRLIGYSADEIIGQSFARCYELEDQAWGLPQIILDRAAADGKIEVEGWRVRKDGSRFWAHETVAALRNDSGALTGFAKVTRDRTDHRQSEVRIRQLNRLYAVLSEISQAVARIHDLPTLFEFACRTVVTRGGFRLAWLGLRNPTTGKLELAAHAGDAAAFVADLERSLAADPVTIIGPTAMALTEGCYTIVEDIATDERMAGWRDAALRNGFKALAVFPLRVNGEARGAFSLYAADHHTFDTEELGLLKELAAVLAFAVEFAERERQRQASEDQLAASELRYRSLIQHAPEAIFVNEGDRVVLVNEACLRIFGAQSEKELLGKSPLELLHPDYRAAIRQRIAMMLETGEPAPPFEEKIVRLDGGIVDVEVKAAPYFSGGKGAIHVILRDITAPKAAEAALRRLTAELEQRVADRTAELEARNKELEAFTYSVSHDLKAPLRSIAGYSRILLEDYAERLDDEGRRYLANIRRATQRMNQLIEDLLVYSRLERRAAHQATVNPAALVAALLDERAAEIQERQVQVTVDVAPGPLSADPEGLELALRNLLDNALKFTQSVEHPTIAVGSRRLPGAVQLWVQDNGIGFDMQFHDRIFDIFQRLHGSGQYPGTGIGLAIVRRAVERMGGRAWAQSEPEAGATFFLEIPQPVETAAVAEAATGDS